MIILFHKDDKVLQAEGLQGIEGMPVTKALLAVAAKFPFETIVWCDMRLKDNLNREVLPAILHHKRLLYSFNASESNYLDSVIGFAEEASPFIPVKKDVKYPTWQMSSHVGIMHAEIVNAFAGFLYVGDGFDYFLNSFAKRAMRAGLLCYSKPDLLIGTITESDWKHADIFETFRFVRQHYRMRWTSLLLLDMILFKRKFPILPYLVSVFHKKRESDENAFSAIAISSSKNIIQSGTIDVIIPTIGRKPHLYNVLKDLAAQTYMPKKVIIVEQNPDTSSVSELDYLTEKWPFEIDHVFTHRSGACAARNVALMRTDSDFVFMADDDIRFNANLIADVFDYFKMTGNEVIQVAGPQPDEKIKENQILQYPVLGSGWVFLKHKCLDGIWFNPGFEFGYGEDKDFGMQLRNKGYDILLVPFVSVIHLKAPMGGFRVKPPFAWADEVPLPKPSPTVMLFMIRNFTLEQVLGYKLIYFFKNYGKKNSLNPYTAYRNFKKQWERSEFWAKELGKR